MEATKTIGQEKPDHWAKEALPVRFKIPLSILNISFL